MKRLSLILAVVFCLTIGTAYAGTVDSVVDSKVVSGAIINMSMGQVADANIGSVVAGHTGEVAVATVTSDTIANGALINMAMGAGAYANIGSVVAKSSAPNSATGGEARITAASANLWTGGVFIVNMAMGIASSANIASIVAQ